MTSTVLVHDALKPAATFPDLAHLKGRKATNVALDYKLRRGDTAAAFAEADHVFEHTFRAQQVAHTPLEPFVSIADYRDGHLTLHTASQGPSFVRIEIARLLGIPENRVRVKVPFLGGGFGGQALHQARGAGDRAVDDRPPSREDRADDGGAVLHDHAPPLHVHDQERRDEGRQDRRAPLRGRVERRRLCRHRAARDAEGGFHIGRPLRHRQRHDQLLRRLHQPAAVRRAARLRRAADRVGLRAAHRHDRQRARHRPDRVPPPEHAARRPAAGVGHTAARRTQSSGRWTRSLERLGWSEAARQGQRPAYVAAVASPSASRASPRRRPRSPSSTSTATAVAASTSAPSTWGRAPTP